MPRTARIEPRAPNRAVVGPESAAARRARLGRARAPDDTPESSQIASGQRSASPATTPAPEPASRPQRPHTPGTDR